MEQFTLTVGQVITFNLNYSFSFIRIRKIVVRATPSPAPNAWSSVLSGLNLVISYSKPNASRTEPFNLLSFYSPYHLQPIFEFEKEKWMFPSENVKNITSFGSFYNRLAITLEEHNPIPSNAVITIFYDASPGAIIQNV